MKSKMKKSTGYPTLREFRSNRFMNVAAAIGIGVSATAISLDVDAEDKMVVESKENKKAENPEKKIKDKIIIIAANLGNDDFKKREESTKELISLGQKFRKEKKTKLTAFLKTEVQKHCKSKDPEVKERAKKILLAITPKSPVQGGVRRIHRTAGVMIQR